MSDDRCGRCGKRRYTVWRHALQAARRQMRQDKAVRGIEPYRDKVCRCIHLGTKSDHMQRRYERKATA